MHNSILTSFVSQSWGVDLEGANFTWHLDTNSSLLQNSNLHTEEYNDTYKADNQQMYIGWKHQIIRFQIVNGEWKILAWREFSSPAICFIKQSTLAFLCWKLFYGLLVRAGGIQANHNGLQENCWHACLSRRFTVGSAGRATLTHKYRETFHSTLKWSEIGAQLSCQYTDLHGIRNFVIMSSQSDISQGDNIHSSAVT